jgi:hypothetical protein
MRFSRIHGGTVSMLMTNVAEPWNFLVSVEPVGVLLGLLVP